MRTRHVVAWVVLFVVLNAAMVWYLRDRMSSPPEAADSAGLPTAAPSSLESDTDLLRGPVFLSGTPDGAVLRLTRGGCGDRAPQVAGWVAPPGGAPGTIEVPPVRAVVGVGRSAGSWWVIGADDGCDVTAWASESLAGDAWSKTAIPADAWYLDPEDATRVYSPRGSVPLPDGCSATWIEAVGTKVYLVCDDGRAMVADQRVRQFTGLPLSDAVVALAVDARDRIGQLMSGPNCLALVRVIANGKIVDQFCFDAGKAPLGIAWTGGDLVAQVGLDLFTNAGGGWAVRS